MGGTLGVLVRNVLLQIRFKCKAFAQKCRQNRREMPFQRHKFQTISEGGMPPDPLVRCALRVRVPRLGAAYLSSARVGKSAS